MEDYEILERLGGGSFADVYKAKEKSTNTLVAIKVLKKKYSKFEDCLDLRECKSLQKLNHIPYQKGIENIIKLKQIIFIKESGILNLVFEYMEKDLFELLKLKKKLNENEIREISYQTLLGLSLMHKYGFFHRDLKPENLLVSNNKKIKIADFGLAREIRSVPPYTEYVSTRYYRAPECILKSNNYNSPIDIWALGCIIAEMYLHPIPIFFGNNEKEVLFKINSILGFPINWNEGIQLGKKLNIKFLNCNGVDLKNVILNASDDAIDLIKLMLQWDPNKRPTANNLLGHPFFNFCNFENEKLYDISNICIKEKKGKKNLGESKISKGSFIDETNISRILNDTEGFDRLINKLKREKREEDKRFEIEKKDFNFGVVSTSTNLIIETNGNSDNLDNNKEDENRNFDNQFNLNNNNEFNLNNNNEFNLNNNKEFNLNNNNEFNLDNNKEFNLNNNNEFNLDNNKEFSLDNNNKFNIDKNEQFNLDNKKEFDLDNNNKFNLDNNDSYKIIDNNNEFNIDNKNNFNLDNNTKYDLDINDKFNINNKDIYNKDNNNNLNKFIENNDKFNIENDDIAKFEKENNTKNIKDYIPNCFRKRAEFNYSPSKFYRNNIRNLYNKDNNSPIYANNNSSSGENSTNLNSNSNANSPNKYNNTNNNNNTNTKNNNNNTNTNNNNNIKNNNTNNNNINNNDNNNNNGRELDFDTNVRLKNINNNIQRRSARKFIEETENKLGKPNNKFQFNEKLNFQNPIIRKNDFGLRRNNTNNEYKNNSFNRQLNNNNIDIGFKRRNIDNNNINNNNNNIGSNGILFGMESRRIHNNNSNLKNWKV